ncbi:MAG TPA: glycosyltransferase [Niabella sp.]|nr:glycosyltransferase [Niabella sp.]
MRKTIIINTSNLRKGGALQVAASFVREAANVKSIDFYVVLGRASANIISADDYKGLDNINILSVGIHPADTLLAIFKFRSALSNIEKQIKPDGVITIFGPCYWKPKVPHIMGFANGYLLYEDTYFFTVWQEWRMWKYKLKKKIHQYLLKREASLYWTETEDCKIRLAKFVNKPLQHITVATNNCSNFFRDTYYEVFPGLPPAKKVPRLLYISSYYPHKGFELIPAVLKRLKEKALDIELVITIETDDYERLFSDFDNVINLGAIDPKYCPDIYRKSDIVFVPTLLETFTAVYPEAMYTQRPILTTNLPFAQDICGDAALYFNPESTEDAVNKVQQLVSNGSLRDQLIANGLERLKMFDLPEERFSKVLNAVME